MLTFEERKAEVYGGLLSFLLPPRPMTAAEFAEWWFTERQPILDASMLTTEEALAGLARLFSARTRP